MKRNQSILNSLLFSEKDNHKTNKNLIITTFPENSPENSQVRKYANTKLGNYEIIYIVDYNIRACAGCMSCWLRTPGRCIQNDDYEKIFRLILLSDNVFFVTSTKYGFIVPQMKNIIDRIIGLDVPYTEIKNGEARHRARYQKSWNFALIYSGEKNDYLRKWFDRFVLNFHSYSRGVYNFDELEESYHESCNL